MVEIRLDCHSPLRNAAEEAQEKEWIARLLALWGRESSDHFYLFGSRAEALSSVLMAHYIERVRDSGRHHLLFPVTEEAYIIKAIEQMEPLGCHARAVEVNHSGQVDLELMAKALGPRASFFSLSWANGLTGVIQPIEQITALCQEKEVVLHVDASYMIGNTALPLSQLPIDFVTFDGQLAGGLPGSAGLIVKAKMPCRSLLWDVHPISQGSLEKLVMALEGKNRKQEGHQLEMGRLKRRLEKGILKGVKKAVPLFADTERLANVTAIAFPGIVNEALLFLLERKRIYASLGGGVIQTLTHQLLASGKDPLTARGAISFVLSDQTRQEDIDEVIEKVVNESTKLYKLSAHLVGTP